MIAFAETDRSGVYPKQLKTSGINSGTNMITDRRTGGDRRQANLELSANRFERRKRPDRRTHGLANVTLSEKDFSDMFGHYISSNR